MKPFMELLKPKTKTSDDFEPLFPDVRINMDNSYRFRSLRHGFIQLSAAVIKLSYLIAFAVVNGSRGNVGEVERVVVALSPALQEQAAFNAMHAQDSNWVKEQGEKFKTEINKPTVDLNTLIKEFYLDKNDQVVFTHTEMYVYLEIDKNSTPSQGKNLILWRLNGLLLNNQINETQYKSLVQGFDTIRPSVRWIDPHNYGNNIIFY